MFTQDGIVLKRSWAREVRNILLLMAIGLIQALLERTERAGLIYASRG